MKSIRRTLQANWKSIAAHLVVLVILMASAAALRAEEAAPREGSAAIPPGSLFRTSGGSDFVDQGNGIWIEYRIGGPESHFVETSRDARSVTLYDSSRSMFVQLTPTCGLWRPINGHWTRWPGSDGFWLR